VASSLCEDADDRQGGYVITSASREFNRVYILHGCGGLTIVQARLAEYGIFYSSLWDPGPPDWRFHYLTCLQLEEMVHLLHDLKDHYVIRFYQDESVYASRLQALLDQ
jgi:hypothetical protein